MGQQPLDVGEQVFYHRAMTELQRALSRFRRRSMGPTDAPGGRVSAAAFRAAVELRLRNLERDVSDLKGRINGLIFLVAGTVITQVVLKILQ